MNVALESPLTRSKFRLNTILAFAALPILLAVCCKSEAQTSASAGVMDLSSPPVMSDLWGTRMPRVCARVTSVPTVAQAIALIQCRMDHTTREAITLMQNITIHMSGSHAVVLADGSADNIDNSSKVYDFQGSNDYYSCAPINEAVMHNTGTNCFVTHTASTTGSCWKVHDGSYQCEMHFLVGPDGRANTIPNQPGPTTY
jgi:hypothetical protein